MSQDPHYEYPFACPLHKPQHFAVVPRVGLEPTLGCPNQILNLTRLPISPPRHGANDIQFHLRIPATHVARDTRI